MLIAAAAAALNNNAHSNQSNGTMNQPQPTPFTTNEASAPKKDDSNWTTGLKANPTIAGARDQLKKRQF